MASIVLAASSRSRAANGGSGSPGLLVTLRRYGERRVVARNISVAKFDLAAATLSVVVAKNRVP